MASFPGPVHATVINPAAETRWNKKLLEVTPPLGKDTNSPAIIIITTNGHAVYFTL